MGVITKPTNLNSIKLIFNCLRLIKHMPPIKFNIALEFLTYFYWWIDLN